MSNTEIPTEELNHIRNFIQDCEEYRRFLEAKNRVEKDNDIQSMLQEIRQKENKFKISDKIEEDEDELEKRITEIQQKLNDTALMSEYNKASEELTELLSKMDSEISEELDIRFSGFCK